MTIGKLENSEVHTCYIHVRRKPKCPEAQVSRHVLLECAEPLEGLLGVTGTLE